MKHQTLPEQLVLKNVNIWNPDGVTKGQDIVVVNGKVSRIFPTGEHLENMQEVDGKGRVLMPSGVDAHVHLRIPGQSQKESPETGMHAAVKGGYGAVLAMPNTRPPLDSVEVCEEAMVELKPATNATGVEVYLSACISKGMKGQEVVNVDALAEWGVKTFTDDGLGVESDVIMRQAFEAAARWNVPVSQHAEYCGHGGVLAGGNTQRKLRIPAYPASAEYDMVARDIRELRKFRQARYHVLHVSLGKTVTLIQEAQQEGLRVSCEVTPHHLFYTFNEIPENNTSFKMNPPLRDGFDRHLLQKALIKGDIAFVATDHAPHTTEDKGNDFIKAAFGTTGMETSLYVLFDMYQRGQINEQRLVQVFSTAPAEYLGIDHVFGRIGVGRPFHAVLVDPSGAPRKITERDLASKSHNNVFLGAELPGTIAACFNPAHQYIFE